MRDVDVILDALETVAAWDSADAERVSAAVEEVAECSRRGDHAGAQIARDRVRFFIG